MKFTEYDTVVLLRDYEKEGVRRGDIGAIIMVYTEPNEAYEVEFVDKKGNTKAQIVLFPDEIAKFNQ